MYRYSLDKPQGIVKGLKRSQRTINKVLYDLLNGTKVKCRNMKKYLIACYELIREHTSDLPDVRLQFLFGVLTKEIRCEIDLFDVVELIFRDIPEIVDDEFFQDTIKLFHPKYTPLLFNKYLFEFPEDLVCNTLRRLIITEKNRDRIDIKRYSTFMRALFHHAFNNIGTCKINWDKNESSRFIRKLLEYPLDERTEILDRHIKLYEAYRYAQDEHDSVKAAINALRDLEIYEDGWKPLPLMNIEGFIGEETRLTEMYQREKLRVDDFE